MRDFTCVDSAITARKPDDIEFERTYGPWQPFTITEAASALASFDRPWWVCGGQALEAFTGVHRRHDDLDIGFFRHDLDRLRSSLGDRFDVWSVGSGMLRPLSSQFPDLHDGSEQVWLREHAWAPWRLDLLATPGDEGRWVNKRRPATVLPLDEVTWTDHRGVRYLAPELVLLMKAAHRRPKDERDLSSALPLLDDTRRSRLESLLQATHPGHAWFDRLE